MKETPHSNSQIRLSTVDKVKKDSHNLRRHAKRIIIVLTIFLFGFLAMIVVRAIQDREKIYNNALLQEQIKASKLVSVTEANLENALGALSSIAHLSGNQPQNLIAINNPAILASAVLHDQKIEKVYPPKFQWILQDSWRKVRKYNEKVTLVPADYKALKKTQTPFIIAREPISKGRSLIALIRLDELVKSANMKSFAIATKTGENLWIHLSNGKWRANPNLGSAYQITPEQTRKLLQTGQLIRTETEPRAQGSYKRLVIGTSKGLKGNLMAISIVPLDPLLMSWYHSLIFYAILIFIPMIVTIALGHIVFKQFNSLGNAQKFAEDSEYRFRLALERAGCGVWEWDTHTGNVYISDLLAQMIGHNSSGTLSGDVFISNIRTTDHETIISELRQAAETQVFDTKIEALKTNKVIHMRGRSWAGSQKKSARRIVGVALNITEEVRARKKLTDTENRLTTAIESMSEGFALWSTDRKLALWNSKFKNFFNFSEETIQLGADYQQLNELAQQAISKVEESQDTNTVEMELRDGRWLQFTERKTKEGTWVNVGSDITTLKRHENALIANQNKLKQSIHDLSKSQKRITELAKKYEQEKIKAEEANRSKSDFLANMSHELRTPLNAINGFSEIILKEMFGPVGDIHYVEYIRDIHASGEHLLSLINDILDMSKIEAGKMELQIEMTEPLEIIEQVVRILRGRALKEQLKLKTDMNVVPDIEADPRALKQILLNLVSNAIKFTPAGGIITLRTKMEDANIRFSVTDTGPGISKEDIKRLGEPFFQIENHQSKKHQGTGLGLALSKSFIELHKGILTIESEIGKGTTVSFTLPYRQTREKASSLLAGGLEKKASPESETAPFIISPGLQDTQPQAEASPILKINPDSPPQKPQKIAARSSPRKEVSPSQNKPETLSENSRENSRENALPKVAEKEVQKIKEEESNIKPLFEPKPDPVNLSEELSPKEIENSRLLRASDLPKIEPPPQHELKDELVETMRETLEKVYKPSEEENIKKRKPLF